MDIFNSEINKNLPFILFIFLYFGFQIFSQIWIKFVSPIPSTRNYIQNFIAALVLIALVIYYGNPKMEVDKYWTVFLIGTFLFVFLYCYAKKGLDDMSERDKKTGKDSGMKVITILVIFLYGSLGIVYLIFYMRKLNNRTDFFKIMGSTVLIAGLIGFFYGFKPNKDDQDNIVLALYLFPLLFLTKNLENSKFLSYTYIILYATVISLWGFFGVEWFVGKKDYQYVNEQVCKDYLGISDDQLASPLNGETQLKINTRNINYIYILVGLIFITFIVALVFVFLSVQKMAINKTF